mmetsp:Transcript_22159/g.28675  ORF Transcript_22159/g.28675 Transcript_22159/m.28675 type:complete len:97 (-) Transcript_22159:206-496(-)
MTNACMNACMHAYEFNVKDDVCIFEMQQLVRQKLGPQQNVPRFITPPKTKTTIATKTMMKPKIYPILARRRRRGRPLWLFLLVAVLLLVSSSREGN